MGQLSCPSARSEHPVLLPLPMQLPGKMKSNNWSVEQSQQVDVVRYPKDTYELVGDGRSNTECLRCLDTSHLSFCNARQKFRCSQFSNLQLSGVEEATCSRDINHTGVQRGWQCPIRQSPWLRNCIDCSSLSIFRDAVPIHT